MAITYPNATKSARMSAVVTTIGSGGKLVIGTSALSGATGVLVTLPLSATAGTVTNGVLTFNAITQAAATAGGTAAKAEIRTSGDVVVFTLGNVTATGGGGDLTLDNLNIANGQNVSVSSLVVTHAA